MIEGLSSGYAVTTDNSFTSLHIAEESLKQGQTLETIRQNRKEVPSEFRPNRNRIQHTTDAMILRNTMMISYVPTEIEVWSCHLRKILTYS